MSHVEQHRGAGNCRIAGSWTAQAAGGALNEPAAPTVPGITLPRSSPMNIPKTPPAAAIENQARVRASGINLRTDLGHEVLVSLRSTCPPGFAAVARAVRRCCRCQGTPAGSRPSAGIDGRRVSVAWVNHPWSMHSPCKQINQVNKGTVSLIHASGRCACFTDAGQMCQKRVRSLFRGSPNLQLTRRASSKSRGCAIGESALADTGPS